MIPDETFFRGIFAKILSLSIGYTVGSLFPIMRTMCVCSTKTGKAQACRLFEVGSDGRVHPMQNNVNTSDTLIRDLNSFLDTVDTNDNQWKSKLLEFVHGRTGEDYCCEHHAKFTVGSDGWDSESTDSAPCTPIPARETTDSATQYECPPLDQKLTASNMPIDSLTKIWRGEDASGLPDGDILRLLNDGIAKQRELESRLGEHMRAINIRRSFISEQLDDLPYKHYDYTFVVNSCCENVIGYTPIPTGIAGPLRVIHEMNTKDYFVPMATTEGALIASTNRGMMAILKSGGVYARVFEDGMTRAPVVKFGSIIDAVKLKEWLECSENFFQIKMQFQESSRFANLKKLEITLDGALVFIRFVATTGDAMGMNMVSKGTNNAMKWLKEQFPDMEVVALSGNWCVDKKASALNWINGRGKSVVVECRVPASVVNSVLRTTPKAMENAARCKLECGSARAATIGGQNAHAANIVAAIFLATGQDAAQVVGSSMCSTRMFVVEDGDLMVTCTMPCLEVGTVGGGTILPPQRALLKLLGCAGPSANKPGENASLLAQIICSAVLAGELSLMAALVTDDLVSSHMKLNRSKLNLYGANPETSAAHLQVTEEPSKEATAAQQEADKKRTKRNSESLRPFECSNIL